VEGYVLAAGAGGNGVIEAPTIGRDLAEFIITGETPWYLDRLPLSRFDELQYDETGRLISKPAIDIL
jgi:glycine/D-amino acid oxidase-like deaminating enzyme